MEVIRRFFRREPGSRDIEPKQSPETTERLSEFLSSELKDVLSIQPWRFGNFYQTVEGEDPRLAHAERVISLVSGLKRIGQEGLARDIIEKAKDKPEYKPFTDDERRIYKH